MSHLKFSTDAFADNDKIEAWREVFGRSVVKMEMDPARGEPFRSEAQIHALPGVTMASISSSANRVMRTPSLVADGSDDFVFALMTHGEATISQRGREVVFRKGEAVLWSNASVGSCDYAMPIDFVALVVPRVLIPVADVDDALMRPLPADLAPMRLLRNYLALLQEGHLEASTPHLRAACATHLQDLVGLAVGATREAADIASGRGVRAARLKALKADITANIMQRDLSAETLALRHGISPAYIRKLFDNDGTSLSHFVLMQRLSRAYRMLVDPTFVDRQISVIAFECGFGDLSYFNRSFRRYYGATPSDIRTRPARNGFVP
ncbi:MULTISPECIES: AraC family transcriptional regulator [unclassified Bradyrhizobium]|uniref:AraC family transcriptional regulator n=1 Tax=unclassified Bradyrhizobium TaxID=2631580 RepID=UPI000407EA49|nr:MULTISPECIES: AraC family transcriptional regulator [unclassified Bradyrhizobium]MCP3463686.1 AraC family transcriptional regulator [Bradyrhizobium sp. CCGUVB23]